MDIDVIIVGLFFVAVIFSGFGHGKSINNITQYAVGDRNFSTMALVCTLVATWTSSSHFASAISETYRNGFYFVIASACTSVTIFLVSELYIPRMKSFLIYNSVAHVIGDIYKSKVLRLIVAIAGIIYCTGAIAVQFKMFGIIMGYFTGSDSIIWILICGSMVTVYSAFGGIKSVTFTDIVQFFIFIVAIPIVGTMMWNDIYLDDNLSMLSIFKQPNFDITQVMNVNNPKFTYMLPLLLYFAIPSMEPSFFQRSLLSKDLFVLRRAFFITGIIMFIFTLVICSIPMLLFVVDPNLDPNDLIPHVISNYTYDGLKGCLIVAIFAIAMSSADSHINISTVLFSHDILPILGLKKENMLKAARIVAFTIGFISILFAITEQNLLEIILTSSAIYMPVTTIVITLTIFGFRTSSRVIIAGMVAGFITIITWKFIIEIKADGIFVAMCVNLLVVLLAHYIFGEKGGWFEIEGFKEYKDKVKAQRQARINSIKNFSLSQYIKEYTPNNMKSYMSLGLYIVIMSIGNMYSTNIEIIRGYNNIMLNSYQINLIIGALMLAYPIWPKFYGYLNDKVKLRIVKFCWPIVIILQMIVFPMIYMIINGFSTYHTIVVISNFIVIPLLVQFRIAILMFFVGIFAAVCFVKIFFYPIYADLTFIGTPSILIIYIIMVLALIMLTFIQSNEEKYDNSLKVNKDLKYKVKAISEQTRSAYQMRGRLLKNLHHEINVPSVGLTSVASLLVDNISNMNQDNRLVKDSAELANILLNSQYKIKSICYNMQKLADLSYISDVINKENFDLSEVIRTSFDQAKMVFMQEIKEKDIKFILDIPNKAMVNGNKKYIFDVLENLIINVIEYTKSKHTTVYSSLLIRKYDNKREDDYNEESDSNNIQQEYIFKIKDEAVGIDKFDLHHIFEPFSESNRTQSRACGRGIGLAISKSIVTAHGGKIWVESDSCENGSTFFFTLPIMEEDNKD
ncbi:MAG TPA: ATP-binding protein [Candidatus Megaira endosymbiont of Hartmannula sinica]|nr:ATP-binding protein [Candidatus Megaera endosymbiont of Hartmannula sinica]